MSGMQRRQRKRVIQGTKSPAPPRRSHQDWPLRRPRLLPRTDATPACWWHCGIVVGLLCLVAMPAWGAAPPLPSATLTAAQQKRLLQLRQEVNSAYDAGKPGEALW
jgi:hypothetical protein